MILARSMMRKLGAMVLFLSQSISCDLNHDWSLVSQVTKSEIKPYAFQKILQEAVKRDQIRVLLLSVRDLYRKKGKQGGGSVSRLSATTQETIGLGESLSRGGSKPDSEVPSVRYIPASEQREDLDLYDPGVLKKLGRKMGVNDFLRVKLTRYSIVEQSFEDRYERNQGLKKVTRYHDVEFSWALIGVDGTYKDFRDVKERLQESRIFQQGIHGQTTPVAFQGWDIESSSWKDDTYFLGLDSLSSIGAVLWEHSKF